MVSASSDQVPWESENAVPPPTLSSYTESEQLKAPPESNTPPEGENADKEAKKQKVDHAATLQPQAASASDPPPMAITVGTATVAYMISQANVSGVNVLM